MYMNITCAKSILVAMCTCLYIDYCLYRQSQLRCLLASEVVHLMCLVPLFFESLEGNPGLMRMVVTATKNHNVADVIGGIAWKVQARGVSVKQGLFFFFQLAY